MSDSSPTFTARYVSTEISDRATAPTWPWLDGPNLIEFRSNFDHLRYISAELATCLREYQSAQNEYLRSKCELDLQQEIHGKDNPERVAANTCDHCNKDITYREGQSGFRLALGVERVPTPPEQGPWVTCAYIIPPIDGQKDFCDLRCVKAWAAKLP